jgi:hypothetical protein
MGFAVLWPMGSCSRSLSVYGQAAVRFVRDEDLLIAIWGGRNVAGLLSCDGGIVV